MRTKPSVRLLAILGFMVVIGLCSGCSGPSDWVRFRGRLGQGYTADSIDPPIAVKWKLKLQEESTPSGAFNSPVILDRTMYFGAADGNFYAFNIDNGFMRWVFRTGRPINSIPFADDASVYFGSNDGYVYAVSRDEGKQLWAFDTNHTVQSAIIKYQDMIVFSSDVGFTHFLDLQGQQLHSIVNSIWLSQTFQIHDDILYFAPGPPSYPTSLGAYDVRTHQFLWTIDTAFEGTIWYSFPAIKNELLIFGTCGDLVDSWKLGYNALDRATGSVVWENEDVPFFGDKISISQDDLFDRNMEILDYLAPAIWKDLAIFTSGDMLVRAFDINSGTLRWTTSLDYPTSSAPIVAGNRVYFGLSGDEVNLARRESSSGLDGSASAGSDFRNPALVCLSASNGKVLWQMETEGAVLSAPVIAGKWIVFGTSLHFIYILEQVF